MAKDKGSDKAGQTYLDEVEVVLPAKLAPPEMRRVYQRKRLHERLKSAGSNTLCWIEGPAGSGKTSLAVSYLRNRRTPVLWYQCDERDADPSAFFHYLALAAHAITQTEGLFLPRLTPERLAAVQVFVRNFFDALFAAMPRPFILVLDNYQDLPESSPLHDWLAMVWTSVPSNCQAIVLSRHAPPPTYTRLLANQSMMHIMPEELSFSQDEALGLLQCVEGHPVPEEMVQELQQRAHGWAAGLILFLERYRHGENVIDVWDRSETQAVFNYFATELYTQLPEDTKSLLCTMALLEDFDSAMITGLTGKPEANILFESLCQKNYFLIRLSGNRVIYRYHPLFHQYLKEELQRRLDREEYVFLCRRAASLLAEANDVEAAIHLWLNIGDSSVAAGKICVIANKLIHQGRHHQLLSWIARLDEESLAGDPWLLYWCACARLPFETQAGLEDLIQSFDMFKNLEDEIGQYLSCSSIIAFYIMVWNEFHSLDRWLEEMDRIRQQYPVYPSHEIEVMVTASMLGAIIARRPQDPQSQHWLVRADHLYDSTRDPAEKMRLAHTLLYAHSWIGDSKRLEFIHQSIGHNIDHPATSPIDRVFWYYFKAFGDWFSGNPEMCAEDVQSGIQVIRETGLDMMVANMSSQGVYGSLTTGNQAAATEYLDQVYQATDFDSPFNAAHYHYLSSWHALDGGDMVMARQAAEQCVEYAGTAGAIFIEALAHTIFAHALFASDEIQAAQAQLEQAMDIANAIGIPVLVVQCRISQAYFDYQNGKPESARDSLSFALSMASRSDLRAYPGCPRRMMTVMFQLALAHGIEPGYVRCLIGSLKLVPDPKLPGTEAWPWPVKINALGKFVVFYNGAPLKFSAKAQKKPLELLKVLVAFGGERVREHRLEQSLWPDAEGDLARQNLKATIHRLRKLIGLDTLIVQGGDVSLNPSCCWVDVWELEHSLMGMDNIATGSSEQVELIVWRLLSAYTGPLLPDEVDSQIGLMRERMRARYLQAIEQATHYFVAQGRQESALYCFQKGLEIEPLAESLHRGVIGCFRQLGQPAEAMSAYQRCCNILHEQLGIKPTEQTSGLVNDLQR